MEVQRIMPNLVCCYVENLSKVIIIGVLNCAVIILILGNAIRAVQGVVLHLYRLLEISPSVLSPEGEDDGKSQKKENGNTN